MSQQTPSKIKLFRPTSQSPVPMKWIFGIVILLWVSILFHLGVELTDSILFNYTNLWQNYEVYQIDPYWGELIPNLVTPFFQFIAPIYDIPFAHLIIGIPTKLLLVAIYFLVAWRITGNLFASTIATILMFGMGYLRLGEYEIFNLRFPTGYAGNELRVPAHFSIRQIGMVFALAALYFFLGKRFILCSVILASGVLIHSTNNINFFFCFAVALALCCLIKEDKKAYLIAFLKLIIPFSICILPYFLTIRGVLDYVEPMGFHRFWNVIAANEADDATLLYYFIFKKATTYSWLGMTFFALCLHLACNSQKPLTSVSVRSLIAKTNDMLFPLFLSVISVVFFAFIWESALIPFLPDFLNDMVGNLNMRRATTVSSVISIAIIGMIFSRIIVILIQVSCAELAWNQQLNSKYWFSERPGDFLLSIVFSLFVFINTFMLDGKNNSLLNAIKTKSIDDYLVFESKDYEYFRNLGYRRGTPIYASLDGVVMPFSYYGDICRWIRKNTEVSAAFIQPTYVLEFRECAMRQGFLSVQQDGTIAAFNRKFATIYLERFAVLHEDMTEANLPGLSSNRWASIYKTPGILDKKSRRVAFEALRQKYLSIDDTSLRKIKKLYPGYSYFLTESSHKLSYPIAYQNEYFILYEISEKSSD